MPAVYVQAHPDDWQFQISQAYDDVLGSSPGRPVVFIYLTAGDAAQPELWWRSRELGARASARKLYQIKIGSATPPPDVASVQTFHTHDIFTCHLDYSVFSFFLRLPDRAMSSLEALLDEKDATSLGDQITTYNGVDDLSKTVYDILTYTDAFSTNETLWFNAFADGDFAGHHDHRQAARITKKAATYLKSQRKSADVSLASWAGSGWERDRQDNKMYKRVAASIPYENAMLEAYPTGEGCTLSEPRVGELQVLRAEWLIQTEIVV